MFDIEELMSRFKEKKLSPREIDVALLMSRGLSDQEIAEKLYVEIRTIKFHKTNVYKRCNVFGKGRFIVWCLQPVLLTEL